MRGTGWLQGWRLTFGGEDHGWDGALATVVQDPFEQVFVAIYDVTEEDMAALDGWESADTGLYRKTKVRVSTLTDECVAWIYVLDAFEGGLPSAGYLGVLADAADAADAPARLRRRAAAAPLPQHLRRLSRAVQSESCSVTIPPHSLPKTPPRPRASWPS